MKISVDITKKGKELSPFGMDCKLESDFIYSPNNSWIVFTSEEEKAGKAYSRLYAFKILQLHSGMIKYEKLTFQVSCIVYMGDFDYRLMKFIISSESFNGIDYSIKSNDVFIPKDNFEVIDMDEVNSISELKDMTLFDYLNYRENSRYSHHDMLHFFQLNGEKEIITREKFDNLFHMCPNGLSEQ